MQDDSISTANALDILSHRSINLDEFNNYFSYRTISSDSSSICFFCGKGGITRKVILLQKT